MFSIIFVSVVGHVPCFTRNVFELVYFKDEFYVLINLLQNDYSLTSDLRSQLIRGHGEDDRSRESPVASIALSQQEESDGQHPILQSC
jgi:hypothetical protein